MDNENVDDELFDPEETQRDYTEVAQKLPVFCVSSRAYLLLIGKLVKDKPIPGFLTQSDTEIPQLKEHAMNFGLAARASAGRRFLARLNDFLNSLLIQLVTADKPLQLLDREKREAEKYLKTRVQTLANVRSLLSQPL